MSSAASSTNEAAAMAGGSLVKPSHLSPADHSRCSDLFVAGIHPSTTQSAVQNSFAMFGTVHDMKGAWAGALHSRPMAHSPLFHTPFTPIVLSSRFLLSLSCLRLLRQLLPPCRRARRAAMGCNSRPRPRKSTPARRPSAVPRRRGDQGLKGRRALEVTARVLKLNLAYHI